jgi:ABC-type sugar transport system permease subunit
MNRLRPAYLLLVVVPALAFALLGVRVAALSRAALGPELLRDVARQVVERFRQERDRVREQLDLPPERLGARAGELGVVRFTIYDAEGRVVSTYPDASALPLVPAADRAETMLAAARRGAPVADLVQIGDRYFWLAYLPAEGRLAIVLLEADSRFLQRFSGLTGYEPAVYYESGLALSPGEAWPDELPVTLVDSLTSLDRALSSRLGDAAIAAAPIKDFDEWETIAAVVVRATDAAAPLPSLPLLPRIALFLAAGLTALAVWRSTLSLRAGHDQRRRRDLAPALVLPALAALWLAASEAQLSARATDAFLELGERALQTVEAPASLPPARLAALSGAQVAVARGDSLVSASDPAILELGTPELTRLGGRTRVAGRRTAYRAVDMSDGTRLILLRSPLEDSRKTVLFWLAGLYALLAVGTLIYWSLAVAARSRLGLREAVTAWAFVSPSLVLLLIFSAGPLLFAFYLSFHEWNLLEPAKPFVGLRHYLELAVDRLFWNAAKNTAIYSLYVPATMIVALGVALLLNRSTRSVALLRAVFFLPYVTSFVAISIVWQWMYDPDFGLFNWVLGLAGLGPFPWLNSPSTALLALMIMAVWIHIGFQMVIFLAGLQAIPRELYEAAMIDGAGAWRRFRRITLPLLRPTTFFVLVTSIIGSFQVFTFVYVMTEGGPLHATDVIVYHIYQNAWQFLRMGYASAMSWVLFAVIFAITLLQFRFLGRRMAPGS